MDEETLFEFYGTGPASIQPGVAEISGLWRATVRAHIDPTAADGVYHRRLGWCYGRFGEGSQNTLKNMLSGRAAAHEWCFGYPSEAPDWTGGILGGGHYTCFYFREREAAEAFHAEFKGPDGLTASEAAALAWIRANPGRDTMDYLRGRGEDDQFWSSEQCEVLVDRGLLVHEGLCRYRPVEGAGRAEAPPQLEQEGEKT